MMGRVYLVTRIYERGSKEGMNRKWEEINRKWVKIIRRQEGLNTRLGMNRRWEKLERTEGNKRIRDGEGLNTRW